MRCNGKLTIILFGNKSFFLLYILNQFTKIFHAYNIDMNKPVLIEFCLCNVKLKNWQMGVVGEKLDIDFVISVGDNFYDDGLKGVNDPSFEASFSHIYTHPSLQKQWYSGNLLPSNQSLYTCLIVSYLIVYLYA